MIDSLSQLACTTCRVSMVEGGGQAASWSIFALLMVILPVLTGVAFFLIRLARRERENLDPRFMEEDFSQASQSHS